MRRGDRLLNYLLATIAIGDGYGEFVPGSLVISVPWAKWLRILRRQGQAGPFGWLC